MKYLLIDFGASRVKTTVYDKTLDSYKNSYEEKSPFLTSTNISSTQLKIILNNLINKSSRNCKIDGIVICTILGGGYIEDIYYSWKEDTIKPKKGCLISGLFFNENTYHIHEHHDKKNGIKGLKVLGKINNIPLYSSMGDTNCVIESFNLNSNQTAILNLGTGSQFITNSNIISFIPSGRSINVFKNFFDSIGIDLFEQFSDLTLKDLNNSSLNFNLNLFPQSYKWDFNLKGCITNIDEFNFNIKNFISSLFKCYLDQYVKIINSYPKITTINLTGGISKKYLLNS